MLLDVQARIREALRSTIQARWDMQPSEIALNQTPKIEMGELATPVCFELAKKLKKAPRVVAEELIQALGAIPGVNKAELAGAGYVNFFLDRSAIFRATFQELLGDRFSAFPI